MKKKQAQNMFILKKQEEKLLADAKAATELEKSPKINPMERSPYDDLHAQIMKSQRNTKRVYK